MGRKANEQPKLESLETAPIWDIWPNEDRDSYQMFKWYRDSAYPDGYTGRWARRSYAETARHFGKSQHSITNQADSFAWAARARAFDLHLDHAADSKIWDEVAKAKRAHARRLAMVGELAESELGRHLQRGELLNRSSPIPIVSTSAKDAAAIVVESIKAERLIMGQTTDNPGGQPTSSGFDLSNASLEDLEEIERLRAKYGTKPED